MTVKVRLGSRTDSMPSITHEFDAEGRHRLCWNDRIGDWAGYYQIAKLDVRGALYHATTPYYAGMLPEIFSVVAVKEHYNG